MFGISKALLIAAGGLLLAGFQQPASLTGCLEKGTAKDTYTLKSTDGKTYSLTSPTVKLSEHVGHKVAVTGTAAGMETGALKDTNAAPAPPAKSGEAAMPSGTLTVTTLKHLSSTCK